MRKRHTEEQIIKILGEALKGNASEVCRKHGISDATLYNWKKKYEGLGVSDVRKLRMLDEENRKLKRLLADKELDIDALKTLLEKYGEPIMGGRWYVGE